MFTECGDHLLVGVEKKDWTGMCNEGVVGWKEWTIYARGGLNIST